MAVHILCVHPLSHLHHLTDGVCILMRILFTITLLSRWRVHPHAHPLSHYTT